MTKEIITEKKLIEIINEAISSEFAKTEKKCSVSVLRRKTSSPNWEIQQFETSGSDLKHGKYSYAVYKHALQKITQKYDVMWDS